MQKVMLIANPKAGSVSARKKQVIRHALAAEFKLEAEFTTARGHATELATDAVDRDFDAVVVFGGDGTINETAQALVGSDLALGILPGGSTNVLARTLAVPLDPVDATEFFAEKLRVGRGRRVGVGRLAHRYFIFCCGMGLDAEVVRRVEAEAATKGSKSEWTFLKHALAAGSTEYRRRAPSIEVEVEGHPPVEALFALIGNARPFTYFKGHPVDALPQASLDGGLDVLTFKRLALRTIPRIAWSAFVSRSHVRWRSTDHFSDVQKLRLRASQPDPIQVDGDYIGEIQEAEVGHVPDALNLLF